MLQKRARNFLAVCGRFAQRLVQMHNAKRRECGIETRLDTLAGRLNVCGVRSRPGEPVFEPHIAMASPRLIALSGFMAQDYEATI